MHDPAKVPTNPMQSLMEAALAGPKTGRTDYVRMTTQAELLCWYEAMKGMAEALEAQAAFDDHCSECSSCSEGSHCDAGIELSTNAQNLQTSAMAKARGES